MHMLSNYEARKLQRNEKRYAMQTAEQKTRRNQLARERCEKETAEQKMRRDQLARDGPQADVGASSFAKMRVDFAVQASKVGD